ncbi:MAG: hypothetical protein KatS3mg109_0488 [Pirellulaceae bacterium]|nr:MAG: hypothetical protein KatS3mg109_0488 [Pirellulaceae bacterium]
MAHLEFRAPAGQALRSLSKWRCPMRAYPRTDTYTVNTPATAGFPIDR